MVGHYHPSVWKIIQWFQNEQATIKTVMIQNAIGNPPRKRVSKGHMYAEEAQDYLSGLCQWC